MGKFIGTCLGFDFLRVVSISARHKHRNRSFTPLREDGPLSGKFRLFQFIDRHVEIRISHFQTHSILIRISTITGEVHKSHKQQSIGDQCGIQELGHVFFVLETRRRLSGRLTAWSGSCARSNSRRRASIGSSTTLVGGVHAVGNARRLTTQRLAQVLRRQ